MESIFEETRFLIRKWLMSFAIDEVRFLPESRMPYRNVKAACTQLNRIGKGRWVITKKGLEGVTKVTRTK